MAIKSLKSLKHEKMRIDLTGPQGNAFVLLAIAADLGRKMGYSKKRIELIQDEMRLADYECLLQTFDREFGRIVDLYR
jgi:hypothetical protein